jgi:nucleoside 2-deoxyribosyltransferase
MRTVYLSGPMSGLTPAEAAGWRFDAAAALVLYGISVISPVRGCEDIAGVFPKSRYGAHGPMMQDGAIARRGMWDVSRADILLVNLLGAKAVSIGTMMEMAWAAEKNKPIALVMESWGNVHDHQFVRHAATWRVDTMASAINMIVTAFARE